MTSRWLSFITSAYCVLFNRYLARLIRWLVSLDTLQCWPLRWWIVSDSLCRSVKVATQLGVNPSGGNS